MVGPRRSSQDIRPVFSDPALYQLLLLLQDEARCGIASGRLYAEHLSFALIARLATLTRTYGQQPSKEDFGSLRVQHVLDRFHATPLADFSIGELAADCGLSYTRFFHAFRQTTGVSPYQYLIRLRLEMAKKLMRNRSLSLLDVALESGFDSRMKLVGRNEASCGAERNRQTVWRPMSASMRCSSSLGIWYLVSTSTRTLLASDRVPRRRRAAPLRSRSRSQPRLLRGCGRACRRRLVFSQQGRGMDVTSNCDQHAVEDARGRRGHHPIRDSFKQELLIMLACFILQANPEEVLENINVLKPHCRTPVGCGAGTVQHEQVRFAVFLDQAEWAVLS